MSNTCYIFVPLNLFQCFNQVATSFTFTSETSVIPKVLKRLLSNPRRKLLVEIVEHKIGEAFLDDMREDEQRGHLILFSVPISQQLPRFTSLYFHSFVQ